MQNALSFLQPTLALSILLSFALSLFLSHAHLFLNNVLVLISMLRFCLVWGNQNKKRFWRISSSVLRNAAKADDSNLFGQLTVYQQFTIACVLYGTETLSH